MKKSSADRHQNRPQRVRGLVPVLCVLCFFCVSSVTGQDRDPVQFFEQIATLIRDNRLAEAEQQLVAVLKTSPGQPAALNLLGTIRAKQGRLAQAESLFLRAV